MPKSLRSSSRRYAASISVIGGHLLLILSIATARWEFHRIGIPALPEGLLVRLLPIVRPPPLPPNQSEHRHSAATSESSRPISPTLQLGLPIEVARTAPPIDWYRAGKDAAQAAAQGRSRENRDCDDGERPGSMRRLCKKATHFEWHPNPKAVEFEGLIPYVHLGKRCVVGLGFFGCAVGALPDANGHLLDDMKDPDRPLSSVPESHK